MSDSTLPRPDLTFLGKVAMFFLALGAVFALLVFNAGCSSTPSPLTVADMASNTAADEINALVGRWKRTVKDEAVRGELACKAEDMPCRSAAVHAAEAAHKDEQDALDHLAISQDLMQDALSIARDCQKAQDQVCAGAALGNAVSMASELRALVAAFHREHPLCQAKTRLSASSTSRWESSPPPFPAPQGPSSRRPSLTSGTSSISSIRYAAAPTRTSCGAPSGQTRRRSTTSF